MQSARIHPRLERMIQWEGLFPRRFFQASVFHPLRSISDGVVLGCPVYRIQPSVPCSIPTIPMVPQCFCSGRNHDTIQIHRDCRQWCGHLGKRINPHVYRSDERQRLRQRQLAVLNLPMALTSNWRPLSKEGGRQVRLSGPPPAHQRKTISPVCVSPLSSQKTNMLFLIAF